MAAPGIFTRLLVKKFNWNDVFAAVKLDQNRSLRWPLGLGAAIWLGMLGAHNLSLTDSDRKHSLYANRSEIKLHQKELQLQYEREVRLNKLLHLRASYPELPAAPVGH